MLTITTSFIFPLIRIAAVVVAVLSNRGKVTRIVLVVVLVQVLAELEFVWGSSGRVAFEWVSET